MGLAEDTRKSMEGFLEELSKVTFEEVVLCRNHICRAAGQYERAVLLWNDVTPKNEDERLYGEALRNILSAYNELSLQLLLLGKETITGHPASEATGKAVSSATVKLAEELEVGEKIYGRLVQDNTERFVRFVSSGLDLTGTGNGVSGRTDRAEPESNGPNEAEHPEGEGASQSTA